MRRRDLNRLVDAAASISSPPRISTLAIVIAPEPFRAAGATWWLAEFAADAVAPGQLFPHEPSFMLRQSGLRRTARSLAPSP